MTKIQTFQKFASKHPKVIEGILWYIDTYFLEFKQVTEDGGVDDDGDAFDKEDQGGLGGGCDQKCV